MSPRADGRRSPCTVADAQARLHDAGMFLDAAKSLQDPDVVATNAIHSAIAAADAVCCVALRERSADGSHTAAIELLSRVDKSLSAALKRALDRKNQAAYESRDISVSDARMCVRQAELLLAAARQRIISS
jgi:hypothetical protein